MRRIMSAALLVLALGGCAHRQVNTNVRMTGCEHPTGWSEQVRTAANDTWLHAQMAANAYSPPAIFDLGDEISEYERSPGNDGVGFAYVIYQRQSVGEPPSWVIAYRGTENDKNPLQDWVLGNLLGMQNPRAVKLYESLRARVGDDAKISVTGHSLGGGLATHVSLCVRGVESYIFNSSPRFWRCNDEQVDNVRRSIVEMGEALFVARGPMPEASQRYTAINCIQRGNAIYQHGMGLLAQCLTDIAAWTNTDARTSLTRNRIPWPSTDEPRIINARRAACQAPRA